MNKAKLFWTGRSQAVRLPKAFRFDGDEVSIRRQGDAVVLEPLKKQPAADEWAWLDEIAGKFSEDFLEEGIEEPEPQERPGLDELFK